MIKAKVKIIFSLLLYLCADVDILTAATNSWSNDGIGISAGVNVVDFHEGHLDTLYAGSVQGFYRSDNGGRNWQLRGISLIDRNVLSLTVNPQNPERFMLGLGLGCGSARMPGRPG